MKLKPMLHLLVRAEIRNPKALSVEELGIWLDSLVISQDMKVVIPTRVYNVTDPDNSGPTGSCNLSTSHAAFHIWDNLGKTGLIQIDYFTCSCMNENEIIGHIDDAFGIVNYQMLLLDRQRKFRVISPGEPE